MSVLQRWVERFPSGTVGQRWRRLTLRRRSAEAVFTAIFEANGFGGRESVSGTGSDLRQTQRLVETLPGLFRELGVTSLLDVPCGDFFWMRYVDLAGIDYVGADVVAALVASNTAVHGRDGVRFARLDLLEDPLPRVDLVLCRDCLVHLPFAAVVRALRNLGASGSTFLLTTTFPARARNHDVAMGDWRPLNLEHAPFALPPPLRLLEEGCTQGGGAYRDKALGLWRLADVASAPGVRG